MGRVAGHKEIIDQGRARNDSGKALTVIPTPTHAQSALDFLAKPDGEEADVEKIVSQEESREVSRALDAMVGDLLKKSKRKVINDREGLEGALFEASDSDGSRLAIAVKRRQDGQPDSRDWEERLRPSLVLTIGEYDGYDQQPAQWTGDFRYIIGDPEDGVRRWEEKHGQVSAAHPGAGSEQRAAVTMVDIDEMGRLSELLSGSKLKDITPKYKRGRRSH